MNIKNIAGNKKGSTLFLASVLSGLLLVFSWPPRHTGFFLFIGFIPLFYSIEYARNKIQTFLFSFTTALLWAVGTMYWEAGTISMHSHAKVFFFIPSFFIVALIMIIPLLIWKRISPYLNRYLKWLSLPVLWTAYEYLSGKGELAMTWLNLEFGFSYFPGFIRFVRYAGPHGLAFLVISVNVLLYLIIKHWKDKPLIKIPALLVCLIFLAIGLTDIISGSTNAESVTKKIAIIQPNWKTFYIPNDNAFHDELDTLKKLALPLASQHPDLIVCSEGFIHHQSATTHAILVNEIDKDTVIKQLKNLSMKMGAPILTGIELSRVFYSKTPPTLTAQFIRPGMYYDSYNAVALISPDEPVQYYVKNKLCPFTERFPFLGFFSFSNELHFAINKKYISYGTLENQGIIRYRGMNIAIGICWENSFPDYMADLIRTNDANMLAIISSNFSLGKVAAQIDAAYSIPLAVKLGCPLIRCANTGISCVIDKNGTIVQSSQWDESKIIVQDIELNYAPTFFTKQGDIAGKYALILSLLLLLYVFIIRMMNKYGSKKSDDKKATPVKRKTKSKKS
jgi:apolipoprotein N-acyltransferase